MPDPYQIVVPRKIPTIHFLNARPVPDRSAKEVTYYTFPECPTRTGSWCNRRYLQDIPHFARPELSRSAIKLNNKR